MKEQYSVVLVGMAMVFAAPLSVWAAPGLPHQFYGTASFSNGTAPDGIVIEARINGQVVGSAGVADGRYGYMPDLLIAGNENGTNSGKTITFTASGITAGETAVFEPGVSSQRNLTFSGSVGTITKGENETITNETLTITPTSPAVLTVGSNLSVNVSSSSNATSTVEKVEKLTNSFYSGATAVLSNSKVLSGYEIKINGTGLSISVTMHYDDSGINEDTVKPYRFNGTTWEAITPYTRDAGANTLTFTIASAQTPYVLFGQEQSVTVSSSGGGGGGGGSVASSTSVSVNGDATGDGRVDIFDFNLLMVNWGNMTNIKADLTGDGKVDIFDFNLLMINWTI